MKIRDKVFGAPVSEDIIEIFKKLQEGTPDVNPGASVSEQVNNKFYLGERTPFVRMWTALDIIGIDKSTPDAENKYHDTKYYVINDNKQNSYGGDPNESIGNRVSQLQDNQFSKPPAGITGISTKTEGALGSIKRTSVSFVVHSKDDFEKIFLPFFLRPGTNVCVDFGWTIDGENTSLYSIEDVVNSTIGTGDVTEVGMKNFYEDIYGNGKREDDEDYKTGYLKTGKNYGRVNTLFGEVLNYDASVKENGSYECSLEFVSQNTALIDTEITEDNNLKFVFTSILEDALIAGFLGADPTTFYEQIKTLSLLSSKKKRELQQKFFDNIKADDNKLGSVGKTARRLGIYHQDLNDVGGFKQTDEVLYISFGLFEDIFLNNLLIKLNQGTDKRYDSKFVSHDCYVRWNENLYKRQSATLLPNEALPVFLYPSDDWSDTYNSKKRKDTSANITVPTTFEYTIVSGDSLGKIASEYKTSVELIQSENQIENPNSIQVGQIIRIPKNNSEPTDTDIVALDKAQSRMPIRDLFISVDVIKQAFATKQNVNDALIAIFDEINQDSSEIFDIKMVSNNQASTNIGFHDRNLLPPIEKKQLIFDVTSGNSIVTNMDLKFEMPKSGLGSMIAIKGYQGKEAFFDIKQLDDFRLLDLLDQDNMGFKTDGDNQTLQIKSLPRRLGQAENDLGNSLNFSFDYGNLLGGLKGVSEEVFGSINEGFSDMPDGISTFAQYVDDVDDKIKKVEEKDREPTVDLAPPKDNEENTLYANSERDKYTKLAYLDVYLGDQNGLGVAPILPLSLTLTVYGNNYLNIGDYFGINNVPSIYKNNSIFQILGIEDKLTTAGWETTYDTVFRILPNKKRLLTGNTKYQVKYASEYLTSLASNQGAITNKALPKMVKTEKTIEVSIDEFKVTEYELFGGQIDRINRNENPNIIPNSIYPPQKSPKFFPELAYLYAFSLTLEKYTRNVEPSTPRLTFIDQYSVDTYSETSFIEYDGSKNAAEFYYYYNTKDNKIFDRFISNSFRELNTKSTTSHKNPLTLGQVLTGDHIPTESENSTTVNVITTLNNAYQSEFSRIKGEKPEAAVGVTILTTAIFPTVKNIRSVDNTVPESAELHKWYQCRPVGQNINFATDYPLNISSQILIDENQNVISIDQLLKDFIKYYNQFYKILNDVANPPIEGSTSAPFVITIPSSTLNE